MDIPDAMIDFQVNQMLNEYANNLAQSGLSFEQYMLYKMVEGKNDLVYGLIKSICNACSLYGDEEYTTNLDDIVSYWNYDSKKSAIGSL
jgi:hypothetical protein